MLDDRKLAILKAIVTDYVSSQEPVGSRALVERHQLNVSSATVRNDMAVLEEEGYITQPHTSAGRIPTDKGYRLFVDRLGTVKPLSRAERRAIETFMAGAIDIDDVVRRTVQLLARITQQVAIMQYPVMSRMVIRHVELLSLSNRRVLVILVGSTGRVDQRVIESEAVTEEALQRLRHLVSEAILGSTPREAMTALTAMVTEVPGDFESLSNLVIATIMDIVSSDPSTRVVVGGVPNLSRFGVDFETSVRPVLQALEEQVVLLQLLGEAGDTTDVTVRIGQENRHEQLQTTSVVAASSGRQDNVWASLGIVGPTRMDYPSTMASVRTVARYVGRILAGE